VGCLGGTGLAQGTPDGLPQLGDPRGSCGGHQKGACDDGREQGAARKDKVKSQEADARGVRVLDDEDHCHSEGRETRDQPGGPPDGPGLPLSAPGGAVG
jgi:hypothetical protein